MPNQLVGQRPAHSLEEKRIVRVLEDTAVALLLDVLEVFAGRPPGRILLAHVTETSSEFGEPLAIGALSEPVDGEMRRRGEGGTGDNGDAGLGINHGAKIRGIGAAAMRRR
jgi:hypothetical protein